MLTWKGTTRRGGAPAIERCLVATAIAHVNAERFGSIRKSLFQQGQDKAHLRRALGNNGKTGEEGVRVQFLVTDTFCPSSFPRRP
jgi:hypothetical protein